MSQSQLCVVAIATTLEELRRQRDAATTADLVELRLDRLAPGELHVAGALQGRGKPVIATCRATWEGGHFEGSEAERRRVLEQALALGAEFVDVEFSAGFTDLVSGPARSRIVLSSHDFTGVPGDLLARAQAMRATGAAVIKLAAMTHTLRDTVTVLETARAFRQADVAVDAQTTVGPRAIFIAMGPTGDISRIAPARFGSAWTYAGQVEGIGQIGPRHLLSLYNFRATGPDTPLYGILGKPVSHSVSPAMHNAAFRQTGIDGLYIGLPAADLDDFFSFAAAFGLAGASVTIPYKVAVGDRVATVDPLAREIGAINTLKKDGDRWAGANTDVAGFLRPLLDRGVSLSGARVAVVGAGGSARAVIAGLQQQQAHSTVHARDAARIAPLVDDFGVTVGGWPVPSGGWDLLVNCTPVGMYPQVDASPVASDALTGTTVYDLVYNPLETRLLREAAQAGCAVIGGLDMLVAQAQDQFAWWTGTRPDAGVMRQAALARLAEFRVQ